jgi:hypothetical protein
MRIPLLIAMLAASPSPVLGQTLWEGRTGPFCSRSFLWRAAELTEPNLRSLYQRLSRELDGNRAWTADVFVDRDDAAREVSGKMVTEKGYEWWLDLYNKFWRKLLPMAEILSQGKNGVLRLRDGTGICSETLLSGDNFLRANADHVKFEILKIYYRGLPPHTKPSPGDEAVISIYVRASSYPSAEQAREFSRLTQSRFQQRRIRLIFRADAYFLADLEFPVMYRFDPAATPPSREEYEHSKTMYCFCDQPGIPCRDLAR